MNRKPGPVNRFRWPREATGGASEWRRQLCDRRRFLIACAGGSIAAVFPFTAARTAAAGTKQTVNEASSWQLIDAVQQQLFPTEPGIPGTREINALGYLQFVVSDENLEAEERDFILQGTKWLQQISIEKYKTPFTRLENDRRERLLRFIADSEAGENWLSTLLLYIFEALLTDPVYGGNTNEVGWKWLEHTPGFPRPPAEKTFMKILQK